MAAERSWIDALRSDALAKILLSRHQSLEVIPVSGYAPSLGFDLLVRVTGTEARKTPEFGVEVKGTRRPLNGRRRLAAASKGIQEQPDDTIPVCLFLFNVVTEEGFYRWLREPVIEGPGRVWLRQNDAPRRLERGQPNGLAASVTFETLDDDAVKRIIDRVVAWYTAKERAANQAAT